MRSATLKQIILIISIIIAIIILLQLYWLNRQYTFEQRSFNTNVVKAIRGFYEDFGSNAGLQLSKGVEMPNNNSFLIKMDDTIPPKNALVDSLRSELEQVNVFAEYKIAFYDKRVGQYRYEVYLPTLSKQENINKQDLPLIPEGYSYVYLYFLNRNQYILGQMAWLIVISVLLVLLLTGLGMSLFYLYKQKFLVETQHDFIRNVTHEFQTPLATLTLGLDTMSKASFYQQPEKVMRYNRIMQGQVAYLKQHINNLVKVIKTDAAGLSLIKESLVINELIYEAILQLNFNLAEKNGTIDFQPENSNKPLIADKDNLFIAILNVLSNAIKYSIEPKILISTKFEVNYYIISIKDNGIGIDPRYVKRLFKKFYRVPTGDIHDVKGLGLGLYFVKKIINSHKGKIIIHSIKGAGTEVIIYLPTHT